MSNYAKPKYIMHVIVDGRHMGTCKEATFQYENFDYTGAHTGHCYLNIKGLILDNGELQVNNHEM